MPQLRVAVIFLALAQPAFAQSRMFLGGAVLADIKKFSGDPSTNTLDGTAVGGGAEAGVIVNDHVSLRVTVGVGGKTTTSTPIPIGVLALPARITAPLTAFRYVTSNRIVATNILLGYTFPLRDRIRASAVGGLSLLHVTRDYSMTGPTPVSRLPAALAPLIVRPHTVIDNVPGATVGAEVAFDLTRHIAVVPHLHVTAFSLSAGGPGGFAIRPGIGGRWTF
jgi:hypothetical protein